MTNFDYKSLRLPPEIKAALDRLSSDFTLTGHSGKGGNGYIFFGFNNITGSCVAIKFYYWGGNDSFHAEPKLLASIKSKNIISISHAEKVGDEWAFFITDHCQLGDLDEKIANSSIGIHEGLDIAHQLLNGLSGLHSKRLVHRDIKPGNIFIAHNQRFLIGDLGSVRLIPEKQDSIPLSGNTIYYTPPESVFQNSYGTHGDIYQLGITLFQTFGGHIPDDITLLTKQDLIRYNETTDEFEKSDIIFKAIKKKITTGKLVQLSTLPDYTPENIKRMIRKATHRNPESRYQSLTSFMSAISTIKSTAIDWIKIDGIITAREETSYRIITDAHRKVTVEKRRKGNWKKDNTFSGRSTQQLIYEIESRLR